MSEISGWLGIVLLLALISCVVTPFVLMCLPAARNWPLGWVFFACMFTPFIPLLGYGMLALVGGGCFITLTALYDGLTKVFLGARAQEVSIAKIEREWSIRKGILWVGLIVSLLVGVTATILFYETPFKDLTWILFAGLVLLCGFLLSRHKEGLRDAKQEIREELKARSGLWKRRAAIHFNMGSNQAALDDIAVVEEWHQRDNWTALLKARIAENEGRLDDALALVDVVIIRDERDYNALLLRAEIQLALGQMQLAIEDYTAVSKGYFAEDGLKLAAQFRCAMTHELIGEREQAIDGYNKTLFGKHFEALCTEPTTANEYLERGDAHYGVDELELALKDYSEAIVRYLDAAKNPQPVDDDDLYFDDEEKSLWNEDYAGICYARRASVYVELNEPGKALADLGEAISHSMKNSWRYYLDRAEVLESFGRYDEMLDDCRVSMRQNGKHSDNYLMRGRAYHHLKQYDDAIADFSKVIDPANAWLDRRHPKPYQFRGESYFALGEVEKAIADFSRAVELWDNDPEVFRKRAEAYGAIGAHDKAGVDLLRANGLESNVPVAQDNTQLIEEMSGEIRKNPHSLLAHVARGDLYGEGGDFASALQDYSAAIRLCTTENLRLRYWGDEDWSKFKDMLSKTRSGQLLPDTTEVNGDIKVLAKLRRDELIWGDSRGRKLSTASIDLGK